MIDELFDQFELAMNEIKVLRGTVPEDDPRLMELLMFSNIIMGGMMVCAQAQTVDAADMVRFQNIVRAYKGME